MTEWHVQDIGTVTVGTPAPDGSHGVRLQNVGYDLEMTAGEARALARALVAAARFEAISA